MAAKAAVHALPTEPRFLLSSQSVDPPNEYSVGGIRMALTRLARRIMNNCMAEFISAFHLLSSSAQLLVAWMGTTVLAVLEKVFVASATFACIVLRDGLTAMRDNWSSRISDAVKFGFAALACLFCAAISQTIYVDHIAGQTAIVAQAKGPIDFSAHDALMIEQAFWQVPRPCSARVIPTSPMNANSADNLRMAIGLNGSCTIINAEQDSQMIFPQNVDAGPAKVPVGIIVRWWPAYSPGELVYHVLAGNFCHVRQGDTMPEGSPPNLISITVGDGYPWSTANSCH